jgi:hypothetical protein
MDKWFKGILPDKDPYHIKVDFGLFCRIYAVKGKEISIFLQI